MVTLSCRVHPERKESKEPLAMRVTLDPLGPRELQEHPEQG